MWREMPVCGINRPSMFAKQSRGHMEQHPVIGTWELDSIQYEDAVSGERFDMYGSHPSGYIVINPDGHAFVLITADERRPPEKAADGATLFQSMMSYAGKYRLEDGNRFVVAVTAAWHPSWVGTEQVRDFAVSGNSLSIATPVQTHPNFPGRTGRGIVKWHRADAAMKPISV